MLYLTPAPLPLLTTTTTNKQPAMDVAYDHTFTDDVEVDRKGKSAAPVASPEEESLNEELQQAYKAISTSPWGARLGAFVGTVKKQVSA